MLLTEARFELKSLTPYDFVYAFLYFAAGLDKTDSPAAALTGEKVMDAQIDSLMPILDLVHRGTIHLRSAVDYSLHVYKHSILAAASLLCQRKETGLRPLWPESLVDITGYQLSEIEAVALSVWRLVNASNTENVQTKQREPMLSPGVLRTNVNVNNGATEARSSNAEDRRNVSERKGKDIEEKKRPTAGMKNVFELYMHC